ncbi:hypothetical protein HID58_000627 [Brassica napus]|uniref:Uncharacterized protein n=1 Tax=Brassica napus TaxID=3708 RepID=A0ABQ8EK06_BRANA|nr:hypothetical protein HID58_000627 [Brassica napus]
MTAMLISNCFLQLQLLGQKVHKLLLHFLLELRIIASTICSQHKLENERAISRRETGGGQSQTQGGQTELLRVDDPTKPLLNLQ